MASYLAGDATAEELVLGFFEQRRIDIDLENGGQWNPSPDGHRWERLYEKLFWACEMLISCPIPMALASHGGLIEPPFMG